jgi:hypothetical protein
MSSDIWETYSRLHPNRPALVELDGDRIGRQWSWSLAKSFRDRVATQLAARRNDVDDTYALLIGNNCLEVGDTCLCVSDSLPIERPATSVSIGVRLFAGSLRSSG